MKIGYARVSTDDQNLDLQIDALRAEGCERIFEDHGVSGIQKTRDGLSDALSALSEGDTLVVWKLDRLGRSLSFLIDLVDTLGKKGVGFQSITDGFDTATPGGQLIFHIMGALAEFERALNIERTKAGIAAARARGKHVGRPRRLRPSQVEHARKLIDADTETITSMASILGVDRSTLSRALK